MHFVTDIRVRVYLCVRTAPIYFALAYNDGGRAIKSALVVISIVAKHAAPQWHERINEPVRRQLLDVQSRVCPYMCHFAAHE